MQCPKDNIVCKEITFEDVLLQTCQNCDGVWIEEVEVRTLFGHLAMPNDTNVDELFERWKVAEAKDSHPKDFWQEDQLTCPIDGTQMMKHYFAGTTIGVDQCQVCRRFWLDGGELQAMASHVVPDPLVDNMGRLILKEQIEWNQKLQELQMLPAKVATAVTHPGYAALLAGQFLFQFLSDWALQPDNSNQT